MVFLQSIFEAFPNLRLDEDALTSEGGLVAVRYGVTGTHKGVFNGIPPSGTDVSFEAHDWFMVENGKITEQWVVLDALGLLQQIGAIPTN
jgi:predicted ester cyclase